jgi:hypothetical protein
MKKKYLTEELVSLNVDFLSEFSIQQLEFRLETDPLLFVDFFQESMAMTDETNCNVAGALNICNPGSTLNVCTAAESLCS